MLSAVAILTICGLIHLTLALNRFDHLTLAEKCPGFQHNVMIPEDYVKHVPDSSYTGNITEVKFGFDIKQIKEVKEERLTLYYDKKMILMSFN